MAELVDIKDNTPNVELIEQLERMLEKAKSGEVRAWVSVFEWSDASVSHGWVFEAYSKKRTMVGAMAECQFAVLTQLQLGQNDSPLYKAVFE